MRYVALLVATALLAGGCLGGGDADDGLGSLLAERDARIAQLQRDLDVSRAAYAAAERRADTLTALGPDRLERLFHVQRIRLGRFTGGYDTDDDHRGDEAVKVFLEPLDASGSVIKAAGDVTITLFDLAGDGDRIGTYRFGVDVLGDHWYSGALTNHFSFVCDLGAYRPSEPEVTVRVEFVDYLTGDTFTAQGRYPFELPATTQPAE